MFARAPTPSALMGISESRIELIRWSAASHSRSVVTRLFDTGKAYSRWQSFHYNLMKDVAASRNWQEQRARIRKASFNLIHRQALFDHLRVSQVRGRERNAIVSALYASTDYSRAVVNEHVRYLQSNSSLFCTDYLESSLMDDAAFAAELEQYREMYQEYFSLYCGWIIAEDRGEDYALRPLIPAMKKELLNAQLRLLQLPNVSAHPAAAQRGSRL